MSNTTLTVDRASGPEPTRLPSDSDAALPPSALDAVQGGSTEPTPWEAFFFEAWSEDSL